MLHLQPGSSNPGSALPVPLPASCCLSTALRGASFFLCILVAPNPVLGPQHPSVSRIVQGRSLPHRAQEPEGTELLNISWVFENSPIYSKVCDT